MIKGGYAAITGASRGIGKAIAVTLAREGMNVLLAGRDEVALDEVKNICNSMGVEARTVAGDLSHIAGLEHLIKNINKLPQVDCLVNNAGVAVAKDLEETSLEEWDLHMNLNVRAPFYLIQQSLPLLRKSDRPTIINISSITGIKGYPNQGAYSASKHALMGLTKVYAKELYKEGIRVFSILPGGVATEMVTKTRPDLDISCLVDPQQVANTALFMLKLEGNAVIDEIVIHRENNEPFK